MASSTSSSSSLSSSLSTTTTSVDPTSLSFSSSSSSPPPSPFPPPPLPPLPVPQCVADGSVRLAYVHANGIRHRIAYAGFDLPRSCAALDGSDRNNDGDENDDDDDNDDDENDDDEEVDANEQEIASRDASASDSIRRRPRRQPRRRPRRRGAQRRHRSSSGGSRHTHTRIPNRPPVLVMLLHGWPESWYSWRHQLTYLSSAGYAVVAPDMRGYGGTSSPPDLPSYDVRVLAADVVSVADRCGYGGDNEDGEERGDIDDGDGRSAAAAVVVVVGHDFGSYLAWHVALFHPRRILAVCGMSVPWSGSSPRHCGPLMDLRRRYGDPFASSSSARFHYILHHCLPGAADEYGRNGREALLRLYGTRPGMEREDGTPEFSERGRMFVAGFDERSGETGSGGERGAGTGTKEKFMDRPDARCAPGLWARLPRPKELPPWLTPNDLEYYASEFDRAGFAGTLKWYQALDRNWAAAREFAGRGRDGMKIRQPALFIAGMDDPVIRRTYGGPDAVRRLMKANCSQMDDGRCIFLDCVGHWVQQERPNVANEMLLSFLDSVCSLSSLWPLSSDEAEARSKL